MRKLIVAAATAATLGTIGIAATAQAQPASHGPGVTTAASLTKVAVVGIPTGFQVNAPSSASACTWTVTSSPALPKSVTTGIGGTNNCSVVIDGVFTGAAKTYTITAKVTQGGKTTTNTIAVKVSAAPAKADAVGVGSDTIQNVFDQFSADYNGAHTTGTHLYSWDATNPLTGAIGDSIAVKSGCSNIARPDGSSAGISALTSSQVVGGVNCINYARSSRPRSPSDPPFAPGGIAFVNLAGDAVTWSAQATTNAPSTLTQQQLADIYNCVDTNWNQVGGKNAPIHAFIPQSGSGTRSFFLAAIGVANPGSCVSDDNGQLQENEGVNPVLNDPDAIFPYSIGKYIAEKFHSPTCNNSACTPDANGVVCNPVSGKNLFGCNTHGTMALKSINGIKPTTGSGSSTVINASFPATFQRTLFEVVPFDPNTADHIPGGSSPVGGVNLEPIFGSSGFICTNSTAKTDLRNYGFLVVPTCGLTS